MCVISIIEDNCYQKWTLGLAIPNFCQKSHIPYIQYHIDKLRQRTISGFDGKCVLMVDAAFLQPIGTIQFIRSKCPKAKIVVFGSDTIEYIACNKNEFNGIEEVYLFLETMDEAVKYYTDREIRSDHWIWSFSEAFIQDIKTEEINKELDVCCLLRVMTEYRRELVDGLSKRYKTLFSDGKYAGGIATNQKDEIVNLYNKTNIILGTTSPAATKNRTMKGFRDFIAPFCGSLLIYDNHPQVMKRYFANQEVDFYDYNSLDTLSRLIDNILSLNKNQYREKVNFQKECFKKHSLEKQLKVIFDKYDLWT